MIVDLRTYPTISGRDFRTLPKEGVNIRSAYSLDFNTTLVFQKNPPPYSMTDDFTYIHYSMMCYRDWEPVCAISIESEDLRELARSLAVGVRVLQEQYKTKGVLTDPKIVSYGGFLRLEHGPYTFDLYEETAEAVLLDYMLDAIDMTDDDIIKLDPREVLHYLVPEE